MGPLLACVGHWYAGLLYFAPVAIVVGALMWQSRKDKRAQAAGGGASGADFPDALEYPDTLEHSEPLELV